MGFGTTMYSEQDLAELRGKIPSHANEIDLVEKDRRAPVITKNLGKLQAVYDSFREQVLHGYGAQVSQQKPLFSMPTKLSKPQAAPINEHEKGLYNKYFNKPIIATINHKQVQVSPADLESMGSFGDFLNRSKDQLGLDQETLNKINRGDQSVLSSYLTEFSESLEQEKAVP